MEQAMLIDYNFESFAAADDPSDGNAADGFVIEDHDAGLSDIEMDIEAPPPLPPVPETTALPNRRATVEEVEDEYHIGYQRWFEEVGTHRWIEEWPQKAGTPIGEGEGKFQAFRRTQAKNNEAPWHPFESKDDWELARWMMSSGISQSEMDNLLKLDSVCCCLLVQRAHSHPIIGTQGYRPCISQCQVFASAC